jgi:glutamyl-tRNA synthetase
MTVRTRVAPSPTGDPHVGTAYVALFNYCFAKQHGGQFILRIEDTDQVRSSRQSEQAILDALRWVGIPWDEGPDIGGPHGPYRQSERSAIYQEHAAILVDRGHAFHCFCTRSELDEMRRTQVAAGQDPGYDGRCGRIAPGDTHRRLANGEASVVRMRVPREGVCEVADVLRGTIEIPWSKVDYQVLLKADGLPTYHLANVVDDHLMGITHVMRGEEWINSAPKHLLLYAAFGWEAPVLCHLPLLRNPDKSKLSKRKNPTSILWYRQMGYLPEALLNYLGTLALTLSAEDERLSLPQMVDAFAMDKIGLGGPVFDLQKLAWLSGRWMREGLDVEQFADRVAEWALNRKNLMRLAPLIQPRVSRLSEVADHAAYLFQSQVSVDPTLLVDTKINREQVRRAFQMASWQMSALREWDKAGIEAGMRVLADGLGVKLRDLLRPFYVALSGRSAALPLYDSMEYLGRDVSRARVTDALNVLGAPSKNELKAWEAEFAAWSTPAENDGD